jgi:hypothetical protein
MGGKLQLVTPDLISLTVHNPGVSVQLGDLRRLSVRPVMKQGPYLAGALLGAAVESAATTKWAEEPSTRTRKPAQY